VADQEVCVRDMLLCFSHLRWEFVFQRPQHLMMRFAKERPVVYWEEPIDCAKGAPATLHVRPAPGMPNVTLVTPKIPLRLTERAQEIILKNLLDLFLAARPGRLVRWYYTPMMLPFSRHVEAEVTVYDCMDELSAFRFAPPALLELEDELLRTADLVFTGGYSLFEAKKERNPQTHPFPSSVDPAHFHKARRNQADPADQADLPRPRLGFYGVIDERFDLELLDRSAEARPDWQFVMIGPVAKIDEAELPRRPNIHYLGSKHYDELPAYLSGWDVALMPFAINEATRFISPTKTPEYLSAGKPVVSTPIRDVERHYGRLQGVRIAADPEAFIAACEEMLAMAKDGDDWLAEADLHLAETSWDVTQARMAALIKRELAEVAEDAPFVIAPRAEASACTTI
jgi:UDP-galactopyranose mutase